MRFMIPYAVAALLGLLLTGGAACSEEAKTAAPPMNPAQIGRQAVALAAQYAQKVETTFVALDQMIASSELQPWEAQEAWRESCAAPLELLARFRNAAQEHVGQGTVPAIYVTWSKGQFDAWALTTQRGGRTIYTICAIRDVLRIWNIITIPKLTRKKKKLRDTGEDLNAIYLDAKARTAIRGDGSKLTQEVESRRRKALPMAKSLGKSLASLRKLLVQDLKTEAPAGGLQATCDELITRLKAPPEKLPAEPVWGLHFGPWGDAVAKTKDEFLAAYATLRETSEAIRKQRLFSRQKKPIKTIKPYDQIGPTFERLFDELLSQRKEIKDKLEKLRAKAEKDRERYLKLARKYGPAVEREHNLNIARGKSAAEEREAKLRRARTAGASVYKDLWRKMVEDIDVPFAAMEKRETPAFKREWRKICDKAQAEYEADIAELDRQEAEARADKKAWEDEGTREEAELKREFDETKKEWAELGLEPPDVYRR